MNRYLTNGADVTNNHWHVLLRDVSKAQLRLVISTPTCQISVVQNGTSVPIIYADGRCCPAVSKVDVLGCRGGGTGGIGGRAVTE